MNSFVKLIILILKREKEKQMEYFLAIDIGASSGRHIVGWKAEGKICTEEVYRFPNGVTERDGCLT